MVPAPSLDTIGSWLEQCCYITSFTEMVINAGLATCAVVIKDGNHKYVKRVRMLNMSAAATMLAKLYDVSHSRILATASIGPWIHAFEFASATGPRALYLYEPLKGPERLSTGLAC
jgi:hypothetical protein